MKDCCPTTHTQTRTHTHIYIYIHIYIHCLLGSVLWHIVDYLKPNPVYTYIRYIICKHKPTKVPVV